MTDLPRLYTDLASWFHLLTAPEDYAEEADFYLGLAVRHLGRQPRTWLELGSGGGNNASHYKRHVTATLVDLSDSMLAQSRRINPELEHLLGDMRSVRLGRTFDVVFIHDAIAYLTVAADVQAAMATAFAHLVPGGVAIFAPDTVRETFAPRTETGGHDGGQGRALRYLEWTTDPDPSDTHFNVDMVYVLREGDHVEVVLDRHVNGLFRRDEWSAWLAEAGFVDIEATWLEHSDVEPDTNPVFVGRRPQA